MAEFVWKQTSPLSRVLVAGHHGGNAGAPGISLTELRGFDLVQVMARRGKGQIVAKAGKTHFGKQPPAMPKAVQANDATLIWSGPDQFLALSSGSPDAMGVLHEAFAGSASLSDQSDGRALLRLSGSRARDLLAKICSLDLHPKAFPAGAAAATSIDHTSVSLWRGENGIDGAAVFYLLIFATFAESLFGTILDAGAEYGITVDSSTTWQL